MSEQSFEANPGQQSDQKAVRERRQRKSPNSSSTASMIESDLVSDLLQYKSFNTVMSTPRNNQEDKILLNEVFLRMK